MVKRPGGEWSYEDLGTPSGEEPGSHGCGPGCCGSHRGEGLSRDRNGSDGFGSDGFGSDGFGSDGFGSDGFGSDGPRLGPCFRARVVRRGRVGLLELRAAERRCADAGSLGGR